MGLGEIIGLPMKERSMEGLGGCQALMKWKSLVLLCSIMRPVSE